MISPCVQHCRYGFFFFCVTLRKERRFLIEEMVTSRLRKKYLFVQFFFFQDLVFLFVFCRRGVNLSADRPNQDIETHQSMHWFHFVSPLDSFSPSLSLTLLWLCFVCPLFFCHHTHKKREDIDSFSFFNMFFFLARLIWGRLIGQYYTHDRKKAWFNRRYDSVSWYYYHLYFEKEKEKNWWFSLAALLTHTSSRVLKNWFPYWHPH